MCHVAVHPNLKPSENGCNMSVQGVERQHFTASCAITDVAESSNWTPLTPEVSVVRNNIHPSETVALISRAFVAEHLGGPGPPHSHISAHTSCTLWLCLP